MGKVVFGNLLSTYPFFLCIEHFSVWAQCQLWGRSFSCSAGLHGEEVCVGLVATVTVLKFVIYPGQGILNFPSVLGPINYKLHSGLGARVAKMKRPSLFLNLFYFSV